MSLWFYVSVVLYLWSGWLFGVVVGLEIRLRELPTTLFMMVFWPAVIVGTCMAGVSFWLKDLLRGAR